MDNIVGNRFAPTGVELICDYLLKQILGETELIQNAISVVKICDQEPKFLPSLSKMESDDQTWYFLAPKEYKTKRVRKRTTKTGFWKITGEARKINRDGVEVGTKKTLVYYEGRVPNAVRTHWVMHEHEITSLLPDDQRTHVACKVKYKGDDYVPFVVGNSSEPNHDVVIDSNNSNMSPAVITGSRVQQPVQEENSHGFYENDHSTMPMNQHVDHSLSYVESTYFSDNNNLNIMSPVIRTGPEVQQAIQEENFHGVYGNHVEMPMNQYVNYSPFYDGSTYFNDNNNLNIISPAIRTGPEIQQAAHEVNLHGFYGNHLEMPMNQHVDYSSSYVLDANQFSSDNNNYRHWQLEDSYVANGFMLSNDNNNLNMEQRTPYEDWSTWSNMNTSNAPFEVGQHQGEETPLHLDDGFNTDVFFVDDDPNVELQAPILPQDDIDTTQG